MDQKRGWVLFPGRAGGEGACEEDKRAFPVKKRKKRCCHLSPLVSRGVGKKDRLRE
ncbi:unnamed protein product [Spirodela intermedia]|uniref:Uncharacterized protein n=1 Tax=Spirodela intermedia TaxID=51605 RepID=A0A7I8KAR8_SPIIN|nr:unnamed protein product [Spirodela intermedia]